MRALVPHAAHLWQCIDAKPTHAAYQLWERERVAVFGEDVMQLRINHTDGYIDDFMGSAHGRRRAFAIAAVHRVFIGKGGADFPLKASKECLPAHGRFRWFDRPRRQNGDAIRRTRREIFNTDTGGIRIPSL